jgi:hypothetical protein
MARRTATWQPAYTVYKPGRMTYAAAMCMYAPLLLELETQLLAEPQLAASRMQLRIRCLLHFTRLWWRP